MYKFAIKTLGCKVNQYEEQVIRENLLRSGCREASVSEADAVIINSCSVTAQADIKTKKMIRRISRENPRTKIFITGCLAVLDEDITELKTVPEVFEVVHNREKSSLPLILNSILAGVDKTGSVIEQVSGFSDHTRAFLKIQDGCDQKCSYCKVNIVRGPSRSRNEADVIDELGRLVANGYKEVVLTGICLGSWETKDGKRLPELIKVIDSMEGDFRVRLSSLEPNHINDALIDAVSRSGKICKHMHIPLQSGSDDILRAMNRRYDTRMFRDLISRIRGKMPFIGITMDLIAGFPGEDDGDFRETVEFLEEIRPSRLHVFRYSDRKGTASYKFKDKVPEKVAKERVEHLIRKGELFQSEFCNMFKGKEVEVLVEERSRNGWSEGYTGEYVRTKMIGIKGTEGELLRLKAHKIDEEGLSLEATLSSYL